MKKVFILLLSLFLLTGCSILKSDIMEDIDVYTTTYPTSYLVNYLYGTHATIHSIYPSGVNFKEYEFISSGLTFSPIKGGNGNIEYLLYLKKNGLNCSLDITTVINSAFKCSF